MLSPKVLLVFCGVLALGSAYSYPSLPYTYQSNQVYPYQNQQYYGFKNQFQNQFQNFGYQPYQNQQYYGFQNYQNYFGYQPYQNYFGYQPYQNYFGNNQVPFGSVNADRFDWEKLIRTIVPIVTMIGQFA